jgi:hypothetical protein
MDDESFFAWRKQLSTTHPGILDFIDFYPLWSGTQTMLRYHSIVETVLKALKETSKGVFVELGTWHGATAMLTAKVLEALDNSRLRRLIVFDNGAGLPPGTSPHDRNLQSTPPGSYKGDLNRFEILLNEQKLRHRVELIRGDICTTVPTYMTTHREDVAWCLFDCDLYEPTKMGFESVAPFLVNNAVLIFDEGLDPGWGEAQFVRELMDNPSNLDYLLDWKLNDLSRQPHIVAHVTKFG